MRSPRASGPSHHHSAGNTRVKGPAKGHMVTHGQRSGSSECLNSVSIPSALEVYWFGDGRSLSGNYGPATLQLMLQWIVSCGLPDFLSLPLTFRLKCVLEEKEVSECCAGTSFLNKSFYLHHRVIVNKLLSCNVSKHWISLLSTGSLCTAWGQAEKCSGMLPSSQANRKIAD